MKLFFRILLKSIFILTILVGCASKGGIVHPTSQRTNDLYDEVTSVYSNKSIPFWVTFPKGEWIIYADEHKTPAGFLDAMEKSEKSGYECAMVGHHISKTMWVSLMLEHGIGGLFPLEYINVIKELNKEDLDLATEDSTRERMIGDQRCAEWEYQLKRKGKNKNLDFTLIELVFLRNNYACRFRIWTLSSLYPNFGVKIEKIFNNISFSQPEIKPAELEKCRSGWFKAKNVNTILKLSCFRSNEDFELYCSQESKKANGVCLVKWYADGEKISELITEYVDGYQASEIITFGKIKGAFPHYSKPLTKGDWDKFGHETKTRIYFEAWREQRTSESGGRRYQYPETLVPGQNIVR